MSDPINVVNSPPIVVSAASVSTPVQAVAEAAQPVNVSTPGTPPIGVPPGGTVGQMLSKASDADFDYFWADAPTGGEGGGGGGAWGLITGTLANQTDLQEALDAKANQSELDTVAATANSAVQPAGLTKAAVGLGSVDNTADTAKPVSVAQQAALDLKAPLASPAFTGNPTVPTQAAVDYSTRAASSAFVAAALASLLDSAPGTLDTLNELAAALGDDPNFAATVTALIAAKADDAATTAALATKADDAATTSALAGKLDTTAFSGFTSIEVVSVIPDPEVTGVLYIVTG
jgi:hypothetical protein